MCVIMKKDNIYIASCSFGKDSIATILLALENNEPLHRVVFSEVMFDNQNNISGEIPEHITWIYNCAIPKLQKLGITCDVVRSEIDYIYYFRTKKRSEGKYKGMYYGFPIGGKCVINRECKIKPIKEYYKSFKEYNVIQYVGIAADEKLRLKRLKQNQISLLDKYKFTEKMAYEKCKEYDLLSPIYNFSSRSGCWFCMNAKISGYQHIRKNHNYLWQKLIELSKIKNLCSYGFKYGKTLQEIENRLKQDENQLKIEFI